MDTVAGNAAWPAGVDCLEGHSVLAEVLDLADGPLIEVLFDLIRPPLRDSLPGLQRPAKGGMELKINPRLGEQAEKADVQAGRHPANGLVLDLVALHTRTGADGPGKDGEAVRVFGPVGNLLGSKHREVVELVGWRGAGADQ